MPEPCFLTTDTVGELGHTEFTAKHTECRTKSQRKTQHVVPNELVCPICA